MSASNNNIENTEIPKDPKFQNLTGKTPTPFVNVPVSHNDYSISHTTVTNSINNLPPL